MKILITGGSGFIGTNLIDLLQNSQYTFINLDKTRPKKEDHCRYWVECDLLEKENLENCFTEFSPDFVIHLAAKTDTESNNLDSYIENTDGTKNVLSIIKKCSCINRVIITSTQFVHQYQGIPLNDTDFAPHTAYGQSKVINELDTRAANLSCHWTIVRPTNIWGPWHKRYPTEFWKVLSDGKYFHPGFKPVIRCYGFVGNIIHQIMKIIELPATIIDKKVLYLSDLPLDLYSWANGFSLGLINKPVRRVPKSFIFSLALFGEVIKVIHIRFPITLSRYNSMTTNNSIPMISETFKILGPSPYTLDQGIDETITWLQHYYKTIHKPAT